MSAQVTDAAATEHTGNGSGLGAGGLSPAISKNADGPGDVMVMRPLQHVVMPLQSGQDSVDLYLGGRITSTGDLADAEAAADKTQAERRTNAGATGFYDGIVAGRRSLVVPSGHRISFCTYFNAFPAGYWRRWTQVNEVSLDLRLRGDGVVLVYRSTSKGHTQRIKSVPIDCDAVRDHQISLSLEPFIDGGWYWFDLVAGDGHLVLEAAEWRALTDGGRPGRVSVGVTTTGPSAFGARQLERVAEAAEVIDQIYVIDHGGDGHGRHPDYSKVREALGGRLRFISQANLGSSGGFARAMDETLRTGRSDYVLLISDDVLPEPEGIFRAVAFADLCHTATLVGGQLFSIHSTTALYAFGDTVDPYSWQRGIAPHTHPWHDFTKHPLQKSGWMHRRIDVDHSLWRMCLVPMGVIRDVGLAMPFFIKWDDTEYGLRARAAGHPTVTLPGMAGWHQPSQDREDLTNWQTYFRTRNRIVTALLYSPYRRERNLIKESFAAVTKHAMAMEYSTAELILAAVSDVLSGPEHMHAGIASRFVHIHEFRAGFVDAQVSPGLDAFPQVKRHRPLPKGRLPVVPHGTSARRKNTVKNLLRQFRRVDKTTRQNPQLAIPYVDRHWRLLAQLDSAVVSAPDGSHVAWYQRDPKRFRSLMRRNAKLHARLLRTWPKLAERYRDGATELTSPERWRHTFRTAEATAAPQPTPTSLTRQQRNEQ